MLITNSNKECIIGFDLVVDDSCGIKLSNPVIHNEVKLRTHNVTHFIFLSIIVEPPANCHTHEN